MVRRIVVHTLSGTLTVVATILVVFVLVRLLPGDPAIAFAGESASAAEVQRIREIMGLDAPVTSQVARFLARLAVGDLGDSIRTHTPVQQEIARRIGRSALLAFLSLGIALLAGVGLAILGTAYPDSVVDTAIAVLSVLAYSTPLFWVGLVLIDVFAVRLGVLPTGGHGTWRNLVLPVSSLAFYSAGPIAVLTRGSLADVMRQQYVLTARAKGLSEARIFFIHALRNAMLPTLSYLGTQTGLLLGGTAVVETVFNWQGLGMLVVTSAMTRDYPLLQGCVLVIGVAYVSINTIIEFVYGLLDPRIRQAN